MSLRTTISIWSRLGNLLPLLAVALITSVDALAAEPIITRDTFVHSFSHFAFPTNVGNFHRVNLNKYDKDGKDVSAGYNLFAPPLTVTVYIYPAPKNLSVLPQKRIQSVSDSLVNQHFTQVTNDVVRARPAAKVQMIKNGDYELAQDKITRKGRHAAFGYEELFAGMVQPVQSELYLFLLEPNTMFLLDDRFYVKIRSTYPAHLKERSEVELKKFLKTFVWPTK